MTIEILDPTYDDAPSEFAAAPRPATLAGLTVGIVSNGKQNTRPFFDAVDAELRTTFGVADVVRVVKGSYSAPAGEDIMDAASRWQAIIAGVGD